MRSHPSFDSSISKKADKANDMKQRNTGASRRRADIRNRQTSAEANEGKHGAAKDDGTKAAERLHGSQRRNDQ